MHDHVRLRGGGDPRDGIRVLQHRFVRNEAVRSGQTRVARALQRHVVIGRHAIEARYGMSVRKQTFGQVITDEAGGAGHENMHALVLLPERVETRGLSLL